MTKVSNCAQKTVAYPLALAATIVVTAVAPLVSLVAVPIFALKAIPKSIEHKALYEKTLTDLTREKFGRVPGQDYTRWDGKSVVEISASSSLANKIHEVMGNYQHGAHKYTFEPDQDCPFKTKDDAIWLKHEFKRREVKENLDSDLRMLRAFGKALIPIVGVIWVLFTEMGIGGASEIGCRVCGTGGDAEETHWDWRRAIHFHQRNLEKKLGALA